MYLETMTWPDAKEHFTDRMVAVIPVGSMEQHGLKGIIGTDWVIPNELCRRIEASMPDKIVVLPVLPYGVCPYHTDYPGTIDIGHENLKSLMEAITSNLFRHGIRRFVFYNGHAGNGPALDTVSLGLFEKGGVGAILDWWIIVGELNSEWVGGHADWQETAAVMEVLPGIFKGPMAFETPMHAVSDKLKINHITRTAFNEANVRIPRPVSAIMDNGVYMVQDKEPTREEGRAMLDASVDYAVAFLEEFIAMDLEKIHAKSELLK